MRLSKRDLWQLIRSVNARAQAPLDEAALRKSFDRNLPDVRAATERLMKALDLERGDQTPASLTPQPAEPNEQLPAWASKARRALRPATVGAAFGAELRELRNGRGHSQDALARRARVDRTFISQMERGIRVPTITTFCRLTLALESEPGDIMSRMLQRL